MARQPSTKALSSAGQAALALPTPRRIPLAFTLADVRSLKSESEAINLSVRCSGWESKEVPMLFGIDEGNWSRITKSGDRYFPHDRRDEFMDFVGNEILLMYGCESRGYDFATLRKHKTELEEKLEAANRRIAELELKNTIQEEFVRKVVK